MDKENSEPFILNKPFKLAKVVELKNWLKVRGAPTSGNKAELIKRCEIYNNDENRRNKIVVNTNQPLPQTELTEKFPEPSIWTKNISSFIELKTFNVQKIYDHLVTKANSSKHYDQAFDLLNSGYVKKVFIGVVNEDFIFKSEIDASMTTNKYKVKVLIHSSGTVKKALCTCKAGRMGVCKHVGSLLFYINKMFEMTLKVIPDDVACTDLPMRWNIPTHNIKDIPTYFNDLTFKKFEVGKIKKNYRVSNLKKRLNYSSLPESEKTISEDRLKKFYEEMKSLNKFPNIQLSVKDAEFKPSLFVVNTSDPLQHQNVLQHQDNILQDLNNQIVTTWKTKEEYYEKKIKIDENKRKEIEINTQGQAITADWHLHRKVRLTSTDGKKIISMKETTNPIKFMTRKWNPNFRGNEDTKYGNEHEKIALKQYIDKFQNITLECDTPGLYIHPTENWLCASPDGLIYDDIEGPGLVEIKCPTLLKDKTISNLVPTKPTFCLKNNGQDFTLKENHSYYSQMQIAMYVTNRKWCDFVIWSPNEIFVERITRNDKTLTHNIEILKMFYFEKYLPFIFSNL